MGDLKPVLRTNTDDWDEVVLRCAVGCDDFIIFSADQDIDWVEVSLAAEMYPQSFWQMLKACWSLFRHGRWHRASCDLNRKSLAQIRDWCQYILDETQSEKTEYPR